MHRTLVIRGNQLRPCHAINSPSRQHANELRERQEVISVASIVASLEPNITCPNGPSNSSVTISHDAVTADVNISMVAVLCSYRSCFTHHHHTSVIVFLFLRSASSPTS
jgi:hypothetical protein